MEVRAMRVISIYAVALVLPLALAATSAHAMSGRAAVGACIDRGSACKHVRHIDGSIDIEVTNGGVTTVVTCPSATAECKIGVRTGGPALKGSVPDILRGTLAAPRSAPQTTGNRPFTEPKTDPRPMGPVLR
jgi:hypothetical protein